jgi:iron complex outermembrane receptor protein
MIGGSNSFLEFSFKWLTIGMVACSIMLSVAASAQQSTSSTSSSSLEEIVVTAEKRSESIIEVPESITAFQANDLANLNVQSFDDYAQKTPNLSFVYGNSSAGIAAARTVAIRGISGPDTTGFYIDDVPVPASLDPRVVDIDNIEVLKGPQGTLYGESSLGGNIRLVTKQPSVTGTEFSSMVDGGWTDGGGSADGGASAMWNVPVASDAVGARFVAFVNHDAGYITRTYPDSLNSNDRDSTGNQGAKTEFGGSISTRFQIGDRFDLTARVMYQSTEWYGFPATYAPLPAFEPIFTMDRAENVQPISTDRWMLPSVSFDYRGGAWTLTSSTSYFDRYTHDKEDSTEGTDQALSAFYGVNLPAQPYVWVGDRPDIEISNETRIAFDARGGVSGTAGVFYQHKSTNYIIDSIYAQGLEATGAWPNNLLWYSFIPIISNDTALFGELYYKFLGRFKLTLGARQYWLDQSSKTTWDGFVAGALLNSPTTTNSESGLSPKAALSYDISKDASVYASAAKGFRAGGTQFPLPNTCYPYLGSLGLTPESATKYQPDWVWSYELGAKFQLQDPGLLITASAFHLNWSSIQQNVAIACGFAITANAGAAKVDGGEVEVVGHILPALETRLGVGFENARITEPGDTGQAVGSQILNTPRWTASLSGTYTYPIKTGLSGFVEADYSFTDDSVSDNSGPGLNLVRPSYSLVNARTGLTWDRSEVSVNVRNLTNAKPNFGDIYYVGFIRYQSLATFTPLPQVVTTMPLTITVQYNYHL